jgi:hypothetical protein
MRPPRGGGGGVGGISWRLIGNDATGRWDAATLSLLHPMNPGYEYVHDAEPVAHLWPSLSFLSCNRGKF